VADDRVGGPCQRWIAAQLSQLLRPTVKGMYADGNDVVVVWDGEAVTRAGAAYRNSYAWIFTMRAARSHWHAPTSTFPPTMQA